MTSRGRNLFLGLGLAPLLLGAALWAWSFGGGEDPITAAPDRATPRRALFVLAHPDDEFGMMGRLLDLRDRGAEIHGVWTIGGSALRNAETTAALGEVGVSADRLHFLPQDLRSVESVEATIQALTGWLKRNPGEEIYVVAFEGGHFQHDLTHYAAIQAARRAGCRARVFEFPLYNLARWRVNLFRLIPGTEPVAGLSLDPERLQLIRRLRHHYPSQRHVTEGFRWIMPRARQRQPRWRAVPPDRDYTLRPHRGLMWHDAHPRNWRGRCYRTAVLDVIREHQARFGAQEAGLP